MHLTPEQTATRYQRCPPYHTYETQEVRKLKVWWYRLMEFQEKSREPRFKVYLR